jgi:hypothetical protein
MDDIKDTLAELVGEIAPDVSLVPKYGGVVMCPNEGDDKTFAGGIFTYKDHVSMEFSKGSELDDPDSHLEGSGKLRRHLKFYTLDDVTAKNPRAFLEQVLTP